jgi:type III secretory pathway component EscT
MMVAASLAASLAACHRHESRELSMCTRYVGFSIFCTKKTNTGTCLASVRSSLFSQFVTQILYFYKGGIVLVCTVLYSTVQYGPDLLQDILAPNSLN